MLGLSLYTIMTIFGDNSGIVGISTKSDQEDKTNYSEANFIIDSSGNTHYEILVKDLVEPKEGYK